MIDDKIDPTEAANAILDVCNNYMIKKRTIIAQQELIWGLVDNLSIAIAVSQPPDWIMRDMLSTLLTSHERDVSGYQIIDPRNLQ